MIDTKELRRLAQAATQHVGRACNYQDAHSPREGHVDFENADLFIASERPEEGAAFYAAANPAAITELLDRIEAAEAECLEQARLNGMGSEREAALMAKLEAAERQRDECNRRRLEAADHFAAQTTLMKKKYDDLRAKIKQMEQQEPVAFGLYSGWALKATYLKEHEACEQRDRRQLTADLGGSLEAYRVSPLYALPGAQNVARVPDGWLPVPEKHPTFDPVDLQLSDGSVLCGCVPQSDGDYWWEGPSGEVFIDPKYANVTHWRLAAAPEVKP